MSSYNAFAQFYDTLTDNVDYKVRSEYISGFFSRFGKCGGDVLDLACGTGSVSAYLAKQGYCVTGLDLSDEMLTVAASKNIENATFIKGDMTKFKLPYSVDCCVCSLDAINHLIDFEDVIRCFKCVNDCMKDGGVFVFDVNTQYKHREVLNDNAFVYDEDDFFLAWDNEYEEDDIVKIYLDFFVFNGRNDDRFSEVVTERAYSIESIKEALINTGFEFIGVYDELTDNPPCEDSERIYFVCKKGTDNG